MGGNDGGGLGGGGEGGGGVGGGDGGGLDGGSSALQKQMRRTFALGTLGQLYE